MAARARRAGIRGLELVLSSACNLACSYCYQNDKKRGRMEWEAARAALELALDDPPRQLEIVFIGGEPLLEFETIRKAVAFVEERRRPGKRVTFNLTTNGLLLGEEQAEFLARHRFRTHLSFDGVPAAQALRGARSFEKLDALLDRLRERHPRFFGDRLSVSITLLTSTVHLLPASVRYFLSKGVRTIEISPEATDTSDWNPARIVELQAAFDELRRDSLRHFRRTGEVPVVDLRRWRGRKAEEVEERAVCGVTSGSVLAVDADGEAYGCVTFARSFQKLAPFLEERLDPMRLGRVDDPALEERLAGYPEHARNAEIFEHLERKHSSYGKCRDCRYLATCSFCPMAIGRQAGNRDPHRVPDFICAYNLVQHAARERFPAVDTPRRTAGPRRAAVRGGRAPAPSAETV